VREQFPLIARVAAREGKPIAFFDIETTGLPKDGPVGILEFAYLAVFPDGKIESRSYLINPGDIPIDPGAARVHGITKEVVADAPEFPAISHVISILFDRTCCVAFNGTTFDLPVIHENFTRYGLPAPEPSRFIDARKIWTKTQKTQKGTLLKVAQHYGVEPGEAHRALGDTITMARVVEEMIFRHGADTVFDLEASSPESAKPRRPVQARGGKQGPDADRVRAAEEETKPAQEQTSPPKTRKSLAIEAIQAHLAAHGRLLPSDYERVGASAGLPAHHISFALGELLTAGRVDPRQVEDVRQQAMIRRHLPAAVRSVGTDRLKPLKEELDRLCGAPIDYVQLRVALLRTGHLQPATDGSRPTATSHPSFLAERVHGGGEPEREGVSRARRFAGWGVQR
jgi:DNA polymerase-3 subunit epsilon